MGRRIFISKCTAILISLINSTTSEESSCIRKPVPYSVSPFSISAVANWWAGEYELDENGEPILDADGNRVRKGGFKQLAATSIGKFTSSVGNIARGVGATVTDFSSSSYSPAHQLATAEPASLNGFAIAELTPPKNPFACWSYCY